MVQALTVFLNVARKIGHLYFISRSANQVIKILIIIIIIIIIMKIFLVDDSCKLVSFASLSPDWKPLL